MISSFLSFKQSREVGRLTHPFQMRKLKPKKLWKQAQCELAVMGQGQDGTKSEDLQNRVCAPPLSKQLGSNISGVTRKQIAVTIPPAMGWQAWSHLPSFQPCAEL